MVQRTYGRKFGATPHGVESPATNDAMRSSTVKICKVYKLSARSMISDPEHLDWPKSEAYTVRCIFCGTRRPGCLPAHVER